MDLVFKAHRLCVGGRDDLERQAVGLGLEDEYVERLLLLYYSRA